jgi:hypothetical protein
MGWVGFVGELYVAFIGWLVGSLSRRRRYRILSFLHSLGTLFNMRNLKKSLSLYRSFVLSCDLVFLVGPFVSLALFLSLAHSPAFAFFSFEYHRSFFN